MGKEENRMREKADGGGRVDHTASGSRVGFVRRHSINRTGSAYKLFGEPNTPFDGTLL